MHSATVIPYIIAARERKEDKRVNRHISHIMEVQCNVSDKDQPKSKGKE